jgi:hypothetical protein
MGGDGMVMGDLVLTEDEVNPAMAKMLAGRLQVTAVHNHLLRNRPFTMYVHVLGHGDPVKLARALHAAHPPKHCILVPVAGPGLRRMLKLSPNSGLVAAWSKPCPMSRRSVSRVAFMCKRPGSF